MALTRPALAILGISLNFVRNHPKEVIVAVAEAIYRAALNKYHPDKGAAAVSLPSGVNLTELQEARDAVREKPDACIKEIGRSEQTSKEGKLAEELSARVSVLEEVDETWVENSSALWDFIARGKLGLNIKEETMDTLAVSYSTLHLNGVAVLVAAGELGKGAMYEYMRHNNAWFKRPVVKVQFSKRSPSPPNIPPELVIESAAVGREQGNFYDQAGPHVLLDGFDVIGSYSKADLSRARNKKRKAEGKKNEEDSSAALSGAVQFKTSARILEPLVVSVLKSSISVGSVLQTVTRDTDGHVRYAESGVIVGIRVFDQKQRP